jgi:hypothetical protein
MENIKLCYSSPCGAVTFLIEKIRYQYVGLDGLDVIKIKRLNQQNKSGEALSLAKRYCTDWRKAGEEWNSVKQTK